MRPIQAWHILSALAWLLPATGSAQVVVNEIMYAPRSPEPEWIELYNAGTAAETLSGWSLHDGGSSSGTIGTATIAAGGYLVLAKDTAKLRSIRVIGSPMAQLSLPSLNNNGDGVILRNRVGATVDSLRYLPAWGGTGGLSLERRLASARSTADTSWGSSLSPTGATPGEKNSIAPFDLNVALAELHFNARTAIITAQVRNSGMRTSVACDAVIYQDRNDNGTGEPDEELHREHLPLLARGDSLSISLEWPLPLREEGEPGLLELEMAGDEHAEDNSGAFFAHDVSADTDIVINEIMFDPLSVGGKSGAEYVELYNRGMRRVNLSGWSLFDGSGRDQADFPSGTPWIAGSGYLLLASDSLIYSIFPALRDSSNVVLAGTTGFSLNLDGDDVVLRASDNATIDSISYRPDWHRKGLDDSKGISLERISPGGPGNNSRNWSSSVNPAGGTPDGMNSVAIPVTVGQATLSVDPSTVSPDADGFEDFVRVSYHLPARSSRIVVTVYDRSGRYVRRLASNDLSGPEGELIWDGRDDEAAPLVPGIYVVWLEAYDEGGAGLMNARATVIVARKL